jgi:hypothetical protein
MDGQSSSSPVPMQTSLYWPPPETGIQARPVNIALAARLLGRH